MPSKFKAEVRTENAAFDGDPAEELARILRRLADVIESGYQEGFLVDANGNKVGSWSLK